MNDIQKRLPASFYQTQSGKEPVRTWLKKLYPGDRKIVGLDIATIEYDWPTGMPLCRSLGNGLWEVRSNISNSRISRVLFCIQGHRMILLHGFVKKTQKTPEADLKLTLTRMKEITRYGKK